jgi:hypothetical protein
VIVIRILSLSEGSRGAVRPDRSTDDTRREVSSLAAGRGGLKGPSVAISRMLRTKCPDILNHPFQRGSEESEDVDARTRYHVGVRLAV